MKIGYENGEVVIRIPVTDDIIKAAPVSKTGENKITPITLEQFCAMDNARRMTDEERSAMLERERDDNRIYDDLPFIETGEPGLMYKRVGEVLFNTDFPKNDAPRSIGMVREFGMGYQQLLDMETHSTMPLSDWVSVAPWQAEQYRSRWRRAHPYIAKAADVLFQSRNVRDVDAELMKRLQSKEEAHRAAYNGAEKTTQRSSDGGSVTGRTHGRRHVSETDRKCSGGCADRAFEMLEPSEEPLRKACAGGHQARHTSVSQTSPRLGQEAGGSNLGVIGMNGPLTIAVVKQRGGHQIEIGIDLRDPGMWSYGQRADGSAGQTAYLTAPELDRVIAALCKARDDCRNANRPKHTWGTYRV